MGIVNFYLDDGTTAQYALHDHQSTYEPGETLAVNGNERTIKTRSSFDIPVRLEGPAWRAFCRHGLGNQKPFVWSGDVDEENSAAA